MVRASGSRVPPEREALKVEGSEARDAPLSRTPTAAPTGSPTATPTPAPENECQCVPHRVVPGRNLAVLKNTSSGGKGSTKTRKVGVVMKAQRRTWGGCHPRSSRDTFSLRLRMVDDNDVEILNELRTGLTCDRRIRQQKYMVTYDVENCAGSTAPNRSSKGGITITATTEDGELIAKRVLKCKK
jgi:hypothetical protein